MADRSPEFIARWIGENSHRMDGPGQYAGTEPNSDRVADFWDEAEVRWLITASWDYSQSAGNMSIPAVYKAINYGRPRFLCDRFYLPATPRDLRLLEQGGIPVFGIESKHQLRDFDIAATSISYTVLFMNFCKLLQISGVPLRRKDRWADDPGKYPMVLVGGQASSHPPFMDPVVDCVWAGEAEDEPGNGGISQVCDRIAMFRQEGTWRSDRVACYSELAREFSYLYFPHALEVSYRYEDRGLEHPSRQVSGYRSTLPGMVFPRRSRHVRDLDKTRPLTSIPLLFSDPGMAAGDQEAAKGCPAWCSFPLRSDELIITREGVMPIGQVAGEYVEVWTDKGWQKGVAESHGKQRVQQIIFAPATPSGRGETETCQFGHPRAGEITGLRKTGSNVVRPASASRGRCVECRRIRGRNAYYLRTGQPERVEAFPEPVPGWERYVRAGWRLSSRTAVRQQVVATPAHGWELVDGSETHDLREGDVVQAAAVEGADQGSISYKVAWIHGMVFGDGSQAGGRHVTGYRIRLHGEKDQVHLWRFREAQGWSFAEHGLQVRSITYPHHPVSPDGEPVVWIKSGILLKEYPSAQAGPDYVAGFLAGWLAAGSSARGDEPVRSLCSQREDARAWMDRFAATGGWLLVGHAVHNRPTNFGERSAPMNTFTLALSGRNRGWKVMSIEALPDAEEVFCFTVPESHRFSLASGIFTMNCHLSWATKPYREHSVDYVVDQAREWRLNMGSLELSPFGPDFPMYTKKKELLARLMEEVTDEVSTSSMRVDDFIADHDFSMLMAAGGTTSITLGLEGNSQRTRDLAGKGTSDDAVCEAVTRAIAAGIRVIKLYMITNWPGEDESDVMKIVELGRRLAAIRDGFGERAKGVRLRFAWTPLLIGAQTPLQWFAPTPPDYRLQAALDQLRDYRVDVRIGAKAQPAKLAFFQACQRASRDAGEAIVDVIEELGTASWGGFAKDMKERLDAALVRRGFRNGLADLFGERFRDDLLGWEFIDTGVSRSLMWRAYRDMTEFLENTDGATYDDGIDPQAGGNEWVARCDQHCSGRACGACDREDLERRAAYLKGTDRDLDDRPVQRLDHTTVACRIRLKVRVPEESKYASSEHWHYAIRRAAYRACEATGFPPIAKRTVRLASDLISYRNRSAGVDYAEFGVTRQPGKGELGQFMTVLAEELGAVHLRWVPGAVEVLPAEARLPDRPRSLWELEITDPPEKVSAALRRWDETSVIPVLIRSDSFYAGEQQEKENARDHVADLWLARDRHRYVIRMMLTGRLGPYQAYSVLTGRASWLDAAARTAQRLEFFAAGDNAQGDLLRPSCAGCGYVIPVSLLGALFDQDLCPRCRDEAAGTAVAGLARLGV